MIGVVSKFVKENQLTLDKKGKIAYGNYNGRYVVIWENNENNRAIHCVKIWAKPTESVDNQTITAYVQSFVGKIQYLKNVSYDGSVITAQFAASGMGWNKKYIPAMDEYLRQVTGYCTGYNLTVGCESCGSNTDLNLYQMGEVPSVLCPNCQARVAQQSEQNKSVYNKKGQGNILSGMVGALLGSLIGVVVWFIIYQLGYIAVISGVILAVCAFKGYQMFGGRITKLGIVICTIISAIMLIVAEQICLAVDLVSVYPDVTFFEAFRAVPWLVLEYLGDFYGVVIDVALGLICVIGSAIATGIETYKENAGIVTSREISKVDR